MLVVTALQLAVIYIPSVAEFFSVKSLGIIDLLIAVGTGIIVLVVMEIEKKIKK